MGMPENPVIKLFQSLKEKPGDSHRYLLSVLEPFVLEIDQQSEYQVIRTDSADSLAKLIDHTALKPDVRAEQVAALCEEARTYGFASVCVNPAYVALAVDLMRGTTVNVCSVAGFPLGATLSRSKAIETELVIEAGAREVDMVINIGLLKDGRYQQVENDIHAVVDASRRVEPAGTHVVVKVIIETALLTEDEKVIACVLASRAGADFVKTSTGFAGAGATPEDVMLMRSVVGNRMGVKAAGGIRTYEDAMRMVRSGANRLGSSASVKIVQGIG